MCPPPPPALNRVNSSGPVTRIDQKTELQTELLIIKNIEQGWHKQLFCTQVLFSGAE